MEVTASELTHSSSCSFDLQPSTTHSEKHPTETSSHSQRLPLTHSQYVAELLQLFQRLLTPAPLRGDPTARAGPSLRAVWSFGPVLAAHLLPHVDREGPAVKLQHSLLEDRGRREEQEGPDGGEGPLLEASGPRPMQSTTALVLPRPQPLQTTYKEEEEMFKNASP